MTTTLSSGPETIVEEHCWPARSVLKDPRRPVEDRVCASLAPTRSLSSFEVWFDELCLRTEGFEASTSQRARIQAFALEHAFGILHHRDSAQIAVTVSFGTVERHLDHFAGALESQAPHAQRLAVILRGSLDRLRYCYRVRAFVEYLHILKIPVGYHLTTPRISKELKALGFLRPDFAKVPAPTATRIEAWQDLALEARVGAPFDRLIVAGLQTQQQLSFARQVGIPFGQGSAIEHAQPLPANERVDAAPPSVSLPHASQPQAVDGGTQEVHRSLTPHSRDLARLWNVAETRATGETPPEEA